MSGMTSLLEFPCTAPGCGRAFASERGLEAHVREYRHDRGGGEPMTEEIEARCSRNPYCSRPPGHKGRCYPKTSDEARATRRRRRSGEATGPVEPKPQGVAPPIDVVASTSGALTVSVSAADLLELAGRLEDRAAHLRRLASSGRTFDEVAP